MSLWTVLPLPLLPPFHPFLLLTLLLLLLLFLLPHGSFHSAPSYWGSIAGIILVAVVIVAVVLVIGAIMRPRPKVA